MADQAQPFKDPTLFHVNKSNGRVSAWVRKPGMTGRAARHYIGYYATFHMAARAQDRAILYLNISDPVNFRASDYVDDEPLRRSMSEEEFLLMLREESRPKYNTKDKSACYQKFQTMENEMEELRQVSKFTIRELVAHLGTHPSPNADMNAAAATLLEIFQTHAVVTDEPVAAEEIVADDGIANLLGISGRIPKAKRSPGTSRKAATLSAAANGAGPSPGTRAAFKRSLAGAWSQCPFRRPRS